MLSVLKRAGCSELIEAGLSTTCSCWMNTFSGGGRIGDAFIGSVDGTKDKASWEARSEIFRGFPDIVVLALLETEELGVVIIEGI